MVAVVGMSVVLCHFLFFKGPYVYNDTSFSLHSLYVMFGWTHGSPCAMVISLTQAQWMVVLYTRENSTEPPLIAVSLAV